MARESLRLDVVDEIERCLRRGQIAAEIARDEMRARAQGRPMRPLWIDVPTLCRAIEAAGDGR